MLAQRSGPGRNVTARVNLESASSSVVAVAVLVAVLVQVLRVSPSAECLRLFADRMWIPLAALLSLSLVACYIWQWFRDRSRRKRLAMLHRVSNPNTFSLADDHPAFRKPTSPLPLLHMFVGGTLASLSMVACGMRGGHQPG